MCQQDDDLMTPDYWEQRAQEARARAEGMQDAPGEDLLFRIAGIYDGISELVRTWLLPPAGV
jgi:hypothetical protein